MPDTWTLVTPTGNYTLNRTFHAPRYQPGGVDRGAVVRRDGRVAYQRSGDGLRAPGPLRLTGRVWNDEQNIPQLLDELDEINDAVAACIQVIRTTSAGTYTYDQLAGGPPPAINPDGLGGFQVEIELWPGTPDPTYIPIDPDLDTLVTSVPANPSSSSTSTQIGWAFTANADLLLYGLRRYQGAVLQSFRAYVWRESDQEILGTLDSFPNVVNNWSVGMLDAPIALKQGEDYVLTVRRTDSDHWTRITTQAENVTFSPVVTFNQGRFSPTADAFPSSSLGAWYEGWIDGLYAT